MGWLNESGLSRLWTLMKAYIKENTYAKGTPPDLYFDPDEGILYIGKESVGYDMTVSDGILYYKERT